MPWGLRGRRIYAASDERRLATLPPPERLRAYTQALAEALEGGTPGPVGPIAAQILDACAFAYGVEAPSVRVLGVRPHRVEEGLCTYQLFGDYTPTTGRIRVWMRTAMRAQVTSPKAFLNTLLHELCHHIDNKLWRCPESPHTRGFFLRVDQLYHHALGTPADARRPLHWVKSGRGWRLDWSRSRR
jgi:hypothetical protein